MTDRIHALTVVLTDPIREDDIEPLLTAIRLLRGVAKVVPHVHTGEAMLADMRARADLERQVWDALDGVFRPKDRKP